MKNTILYFICTFCISLHCDGQENNIQISAPIKEVTIYLNGAEIREDVGETKFIGTKRTESFTYELQVKNNRTVPITIKIQDQVPVSQESDISVDIEQLSGANLHSPSGRLQWVKTIPAGENIKHQIAFSVKYPKNKVVPIRQQRVIRTPRYRG